MRKLFGLLAVLSLCWQTGFAQPRGIAGTVVNESDGTPVAGALILVKGTSTAATTDAAGRFNVQAAADAVLTVSSFGLVSQDVAVEGRTNLIVSMAADATALEEVVVVGYGTVRKTDMTGAVSVLSDTKLKTVTTPRVEDMLSGKSPGVYVGSGTSQPGSTGVIIIRGKTSVNSSTNPLWVVDGVIMGTAAGDINTADIESMTVLKDAASTAIYGSQGSNGVIIVSTKKGRSGKAVVNFSAKAGMNVMDMGNLEMMNGAELYDYFNSMSNKNFGSWFTEDLKKRNFNWKDHVSQTGYTQDYSVSVRGGNEKLRTYASLGYYNETGTVKGYEYERFSGRFNADWKVFKWLTVKPAISIARRNLDNRQHSASYIYSSLPWNAAVNADGSIFGYGSEADQPWVAVSNTSYSYMYNMQWNYSWDRFHEISTNVDFSAKITDWLSFESVNNYRYNASRGFSYTDPRSLGQTNDGSIYNSASETDRFYFNHLLRFNKTFNDRHTVSAIAAYEWSDYYYDYFNTTKLGIPAEADNLALGVNPSTTTGGVSDYALQSFFVNANYSFDNRYFAQASIRRDGSSRFGEDKRYGTFFALSGSWNIHNEQFFESIRPTVNQLKLRASYGSTGNLPTELYGNYDIYSTNSQYSYNGGIGALISGRLGNKTMTWETTYTTNVGLDASLWNSRLNLSVDLYDKATSGLLWSTPLPSVWGVTSVYRNVGNVNNRGIEFSIDGDIIRTKDWRWNIGANIGANKNKIKSLYGGLTDMKGNSDINTAGAAEKRFRVGYDMDSWYLVEWAGVDPEDGQPQWYMNDEVNGREITKDISKAKQIIAGSYTPKFYGGFNTSVNWRFMDLSATFSYSYGGKIFNYSRVEYDSDGAYTDRNAMKLQKGWSRWEKPGDIATHPQPLVGGNNGAQNASTRYLEDGSYLKLRNLTLGATLPIKSSWLSEARVYVSGENLFTITKYSGTDPEIPVNDSVTGSMQVIGTGTAVYPGVKRFMFGVNLTF